MRKIKTKGLKFKAKAIDKGPRFALVFHEVKNAEKAKEGGVEVPCVGDEDGH